MNGLLKERIVCRSIQRRLWISLLIAGGALCLHIVRCIAPAFCTPNSPGAPVTVTATDSDIAVDNAIITLTISRKSSNVESLIFHHDGQDTSMGKDGRAMYFDSNCGTANLSPALAARAPKAGYTAFSAVVQSVEVTESTPDFVDITAKGGPSTYYPFAAELHYVVRRGVSGFYTYIVLYHGKGMPAGSIAQTRTVFSGPAGTSLYTAVGVDDSRVGPVDNTPEVKAVSDATFLMGDGNVYCKYNNSAFMATHHFHGMLGHGVGIWVINPSNEYINGGPIKQELTVHKDNTLLNMIDGGHFGGGQIAVDTDQEWTKLFGPFLTYVNSGKSSDQIYANARAAAVFEEQQWPYRWLHNSEFPLDRGTVTGKLKLTDGESTANAWIVLAEPGGDWPEQADNYEFWTQAASDGSFQIPKVRPGTYALYAYGANQFEELERDGVSVSAGTSAKLGVIRWQPVKHGVTIWQIGSPDRTTLKYRGGQDNWGPDGMRHWANYLSYPAEFPDDVNFTIGKSKEATDWNYAQWTWYCKYPYWRINFNVAHPKFGIATLTFGIAAADPLQDPVRDALGTKPIVPYDGVDAAPIFGTTHEVIKVNGHQVGVLLLQKTGAAAYRSSGEDSPYQVKYITFPANLLVRGQNTVTLGDQDATPFPAVDVQLKQHVGAIMFDSIRLEVDSRSGSASAVQRGLLSTKESRKI